MVVRANQGSYDVAGEATKCNGKVCNYSILPNHAGGENLFNHLGHTNRKDARAETINESSQVKERNVGRNFQKRDENHYNITKYDSPSFSEFDDMLSHNGRYHTSD